MAEKSVAKKKKKKWFNILATKEFKEQIIGESLSFDGSSLIGKSLEASLFSLAGDVKAQHVKIIFRIKEIKEGNALTNLVGYELSSAYVKRIVRKGTKKIEDSFLCESKDGVKIRIKPVILASGKPNQSVLTRIRKVTREFLSEEIKKQNFSIVLGLILAHKLQSSLRSNVKKIYPVSVCEFRIINIL